ncbi:hypothetical protein DL96DRAFT_1462486 [Flagelloscypha sp. PMI_526]|nr:hypothetical protein DL96DRAFT_1462486 [Flagelloscypha sp. PMI_526]
MLIGSSHRSSTFGAVNRLPYAKRATFNPEMSCYPGTRMHLLSIIYEWMDQKRFKQPILWLKGLFGAGKSAISHSVAREASDQKVLASAFFMTPGTTSRDVGGPSTQSMNMPSIDNLVSTLIRDLAGISPNFRDAVGAELESSPRLMTASPIEQLDQLFYPLLPQLPRDRKFLWVIDGFDEIIRQDREGLRGRDILRSLIQHGQTLYGSNFIIFVTSRPFESHPFEKFTGDYILPLVLDLATPENTNDMDTIAYSELQKIAELRKSVFDCPLRNSTLANAFRDKAAGLPLWLKIVRNFLMKSIDPNRALLDLIKPEIGPIGYRQRINETYASVIKAQIDLTDPDNQRYLNDVIVILLSLQRPVSLSVLSELFDGAEDLPTAVIHAVLHAIHPLLIGLDNNNPVEFIHLSLRGFFQDSSNFGDLIQLVPKPRDFARGHSFLLARTLHVLQTRLEVAQIVYETQDGRVPDHQPDNSRTSDALVYSASAWIHHIIRGSTERSSTFDVLDSFLARNFAEWLEFHICFGSFLFSSEFMGSLQNIHEDHYVRFSSTIKHHSVAYAFEKISHRLLDSNRFQEAVSAGSQAVLSWRLQNATVDFHFDLETKSHLALSLGTLARAQHELRHPGALTTSKESLQIYRSLVAEKPAAFKSDLTFALGNFSSILFHAGLQAEAFQSSQQSVELLRELVIGQPASFNGNLASALNNLSSRFNAAGKREEAFEASQQSVALYRKLASQRPAVFNGKLALALNNLSNRLAAAGKREEAFEASQQSVALYRKLASQRPTVFNADLARVLSNLSIRSTAVGKSEEAFEASQQSVELYHVLAAERPAVFIDFLARALNIFYDHSYHCGRLQEAHELFRSSMNLFPPVADASSGKWAKCLARFAKIAWSLQDHVMAMALLEESITLYKGLVDDNPGKYQNKLTAALDRSAEWKRGGLHLCLRQKRETGNGTSLMRRTICL